MEYKPSFADQLDVDYICHHGIKGMHWGVRRFQNPDGTLTSAGKARAKSNQTSRSNLKINKKVLSRAAIIGGAAIAGAVAYQSLNSNTLRNQLRNPEEFIDKQYRVFDKQINDKNNEYRDTFEAVKNGFDNGWASVDSNLCKTNASIMNAEASALRKYHESQFLRKIDKDQKLQATLRKMPADIQLRFAHKMDDQIKRVNEISFAWDDYAREYRFMEIKLKGKEREAYVAKEAQRLNDALSKKRTEIEEEERRRIRKASNRERANRESREQLEYHYIGENK